MVFFLFYVSTIVGNSIVAKRFDKKCLVFLNHKVTLLYMVDPDMVDFNVILWIV